MLSRVLTPLAAAYLPGLDMEALAHVALGGLYGAALYIARSPEPASARVQADAVLDSLITGLRTGAGRADRQAATTHGATAPAPVNRHLSYSARRAEAVLAPAAQAAGATAPVAAITIPASASTTVSGPR